MISRSFSQFVEARVVTEQDVAEGRYQITDVVLPMPGFDVQYPANEIAAMYRQLIKDDLGLEEYDWRHPIKYVEALLSTNTRLSECQQQQGIIMTRGVIHWRKCGPKRTLSSNQL
jgi:hypothetical protein